MKKKEWVNNNKMLFESGHRTFDRQTNCIGTGNMIANTQVSFFIRPRIQTECNGQAFPVGDLRAFDMKKWHLPWIVRDMVLGLTERRKIILYQFHHWNDDKRIVHGYVATTPGHRLLRTFIIGPTYKSGLVIAEATKYITD